MAIAPVNTSSFTPAQLSAFTAANSLGSGVQTYNSNQGQTPANASIPTFNAQATPQNTPKPTLSANVSTPVPPPSSPAPAVINSSQATKFLGNVGTQIGNLNNDASSQISAKDLASFQQANPGKTFTDEDLQHYNQAGTNSVASPSNGTVNSSDPASQLQGQISDILNNLGEGESQIDDAQNSAQTTNNEGQPASFQDAEQENQMQEAQQYQQYAGLLSSIQQGTYPLSAPEQALLSSTQSQFTQAIAQQQIANQAYTGQITEAMASLGINTSAPTSALGNIFGAISTGQSKISDLNTQMAQSVANLQLGFQKQDYDQVQQEWDNMSKQFEDRQSALSDMQKQTSDALQQQKSDMVDYAKTAISAIQSVATMSYTEQQDAIKNALSQSQLDEKTQADITSEATANYAAAKGTYAVDSTTGELYDTRTGQPTGQYTSNAVPNGVAQPGNTGVPIVDNNTRTTSSGVPYIDSTNLTSAEKTVASQEAATLGIPYVGASQAAALSKIDDARSNLQDISTTLTGLLPTDATGHILQGDVNNRLSAYFQTNDQLASFSTYRSAAIGVLQALAGGTGSGLRINQAEIAMSVANDIPQITDTVGVAQAKIAKINGMLNNAESSMFGQSTYDKFNADAAAQDLSTYAKASPDHATQVQQLHQAQPNLTPYQVLQVVQP